MQTCFKNFIQIQEFIQMWICEIWIKDEHWMFLIS